MDIFWGILIVLLGAICLSICIACVRWINDSQLDFWEYLFESFVIIAIVLFIIGSVITMFYGLWIATGGTNG